MTKVVIYTSPLCGFCYNAKTLLKDKNVEYEEVDIIVYPKRRLEMMDRANGRHTVPQIFIGRIHIGGFDELHKLEIEGKLKNFFNGKFIRLFINLFCFTKKIYSFSNHLYDCAIK